MSSNVVLALQAKPGEVNHLLEFFADFHDQIIEAGALTTSLMQDEDDPDHVLEVEVWPAAEEHKNFFAQAIASGALKALDAWLLGPLQVNYLDTVKYSRNRQR